MFFALRLCCRPHSLIIVSSCLVRSCNRSLEAEDPDDASISASSGPSSASRNNSFKDYSRNQSVILLLSYIPTVFAYRQSLLLCICKLCGGSSPIL